MHAVLDVPRVAVDVDGVKQGTHDVEGGNLVGTGVGDIEADLVAHLGQERLFHQPVVIAVEYDV
ncbi:hypothetical protein D3C80_1979560 [compost metagenome]